MKPLWLTLCATALATTSCQSILGIEEGTTVTAGEGGGGGVSASGGGGSAPLGPWSCLGRVEDSAEETIRHRYVFVDNLGNPVTGFPVDRCESSDHACNQPMTTNGPDGEGVFNLELPTSFSGFLQLQSASSVPYLLELGPRTNHLPSLANRRVPLYTTLQVVAFFTFAGEQYTAGRGVIGLFNSDCDGAPAGGVQVSVEGADNETSSIYFDENAQAVEDMSTVDDVGAAIIINVPIGNDVEVVSVRAFDQALIGRARVHVRPDTATVLFLGPTKR